jgi:exoribonuclease R
MKHGRTDFRDLVAVAVDPADALERDDAYSVAEKDGEHWILVHIADATRLLFSSSFFLSSGRN